ncbi:MAG: hypothetical protein Fur0036_02670 [Fimbriimonadaceae bacterium]
MIVALYAAGLLLAPVTETWNLQVGDVKRTALVYKPTKKTEGAPPLILAFHGHGGNGRNAARSFSLHEAMPEAVVIYPDGLVTRTQRDPQGNRPGWSYLEGPGSNKDFAFVDALIAKAGTEFKTVPSRTFAMGHSNGGGFCYALWRFKPDTFAAFAPSAAKGSRFGGPTKPFYIVASRNDTIVPYAEQEASFKDMIARMKMEEKGTKGRITQYANPDGVRMEIYIDGGTHAFAKDSVPGMVAFFRSLL